MYEQLLPAKHKHVPNKLQTITITDYQVDFLICLWKFWNSYSDILEDGACGGMAAAGPDLCENW